MAPDVEPSALHRRRAQRSRPTHGTFHGPVHLVGTAREGWGFRCGCGYRSPLFATELHARQCMADHSARPAMGKRRWPFNGRARWAGWPAERRRDDVDAN